VNNNKEEEIFVNPVV